MFTKTISLSASNTGAKETNAKMLGELRFQAKLIAINGVIMLLLIIHLIVGAVLGLIWAPNAWAYFWGMMALLRVSKSHVQVRCVNGKSGKGKKASPTKISTHSGETTNNASTSLASTAQNTVNSTVDSTLDCNNPDTGSSLPSVSSPGAQSSRSKASSSS